MILIYEQTKRWAASYTCIWNWRRIKYIYIHADVIYLIIYCLLKKHYDVYVNFALYRGKLIYYIFFFRIIRHNYLKAVDQLNRIIKFLLQIRLSMILWPFLQLRIWPQPFSNYFFINKKRSMNHFPIKCILNFTGKKFYKNKSETRMRWTFKFVYLRHISGYKSKCYLPPPSIF